MTGSDSDSEIEIIGPIAGCSSEKTAVDFEMPNALKRPREASYSVRSLYGKVVVLGVIDIDPEYQRGISWNRDKQMMLIDSVFTNHYIPSLIFSVAYDAKRNEKQKTCLDGKQRLTSLRFDTSKLWWFRVSDSESSKKLKNILPDDVRASFVNRQIKCTEFDELDDDEEREIFQRVQLGVALSAAEKLKVSNTCRSRFVNELKDLYVTQETLAAPSLRWERSQGADFRCIAQSVYIIYKWEIDGPSSVKSVGTSNQLKRWLESDATPITPQFSCVVKRTFAIMVELTANYPEPFLLYPKVSPVEFIGVLTLIYVHGIIPSAGKQLTSAELSAAFTQMRQVLRHEHHDIRLNDRVGKTIIGFI
ncbi:hypothetical protein EV360DRAFT_54674, partial [Lentinula raphanica]